jgi:hypothetical protein
MRLLVLSVSRVRGALGHPAAMRLVRLLLPLLVLTKGRGLQLCKWLSCIAQPLTHLQHISYAS